MPPSLRRPISLIPIDLRNLRKMSLPAWRNSLMLVNGLTLTAIAAKKTTLTSGAAAV